MEIFRPLTILFLGLSLALYYLLPKKCAKYVILAMSLALFIYASTWGVLYMLALSLFTYLAGLLISKIKSDFEKIKKDLPKEERKKEKAKAARKSSCVVALHSIISILILALLKYSNMFAGGINSIFGKDILPAFHFLVPLGISYYTLMAISYVVDVSRGSTECEKNPLNLLLFVSWTPHIIEGPFDSYSSFRPQIEERPKFSYDRFTKAFCLILLGCLKKNIVADRISYLSNEVFGNIASYSGLAVFIGIIAFAVSLYFDFSGCIDVLRGISELFGITLAENFNRPFFSKSVQEFWRRWHISLGTWLKNYIFYPISLSKLGKKISTLSSKLPQGYYSSIIPTVLPLLGVWTVMGIWHGADFRYLVYGLYFFAVILVGMLLEPLIVKFFEKTKLNRDGKVMNLVKTLRTIVTVLFGLTLFRAESLPDFTTAITSLFKTGGTNGIFSASPDVTAVDFVLAAAFAIAFFVLEYLAEKKNIDICQKITSSEIGRWIFITVAIALVILFGIYGSGYSGQASIYADF